MTSTVHVYTENLLAVRRILREHAAHHDFSVVLTHLELHEFDQAIAALGRVKYVPDANVIPNPMLVVAAEIRNAKRYYERQAAEGAHAG